MSATVLAHAAPTGGARDILQRAFAAALQAVDPEPAIRRFCRLEDDLLRLGDSASIPLAGVDRILLVGAGKATPRLTAGALAVLGGRTSGGVITTKDGHGLPLPGIDLWEAAHPYPDTRGLAGAAETLRLTRAAGPSDLVLCLLSGGASALWPAPPAGVSVDDLRRTTSDLLAGGVPIGELNAVRKHLSRIAGGQLARAAAPARLVTIAVSDVVGSPPEVIGSGPTVPDPTTYGEALTILRDRQVSPPPAVERHLRLGAAGAIPETPKASDPLWERTCYHVVLENRQALEAAAAWLRHSGYSSRVMDERMEGEAREVAETVVREALRARAESPSGRLALLWGGETTVTLRGDGKGGRNQEMAAAAALALRGATGILIGCLATDGTDGPTDAAGGIVDGGTVARGAAAGRDPEDALARNDAYPFLRASGDLLVTGPTGTNVNDLVIALLD